ncbi:ABC transporter ATP-binding protein [Pseudactinotalea sp. Z1732]|uniref:ABC transporter ATP-binding protein n=2 Tax=Micrococcales TaxID=85006 RepID=UPI003C7A5E0B
MVALQLMAGGVLAGQVLTIEMTLNAILDIDQGGRLAALLLPVGLLALLTALGALLGSLQGSLRRLVGERVALSMWHRVLEVSTTVPLKQFESTDFYDRLERVRSLALTRPFQVTNGVLACLGALAASIGVGGALFLIHPALIPLLVLGGIPLLITSRRESRLEFNFNVAQTPRNRRRTYISFLLTQRDDAKEIRAFGIGRMLRERFDGLYRAYLTDLSRHIRIRALYNAAGNIGSAVMLGLTLFLVVWLISRGEVTVAGAGAAIVAIRMLAGQVQAFFGGTQTIFESGLFIDDLEEFMRIAPAPELPGSTSSAPPDFTTLTARDVHFTYPGREEAALNGVTVDLARGELVALVGENGSGKTTLAKLIANLYRPDSGAILWDGVDTDSFDQNQLRSRMAVIFQDFVRYAFDGTENIAISRPDQPPDEDGVRHAARTAGAHDFLEALPHGFGTNLSRMFDDGHELSGGQWQRVAIARAFYRAAPLIILDEPSAALDPRAEAELFSNLRHTLQGRTALVISHRFSTVRNADRIYVLDQGRVVEHGSHNELMRNQGLYAELFTLQASAYTDGHA